MTGTQPARTFDAVPEHIRRALSAEQADVLRHQLARSPLPATGSPIADARAEYRAERAYWNVGGPGMARTDEHTLELAGTAVRVRIHRPLEAPVLPAIIFSHGGGFMVGDLDTHDRIQRVLAAGSGAAVIGIDYSLAPEAVFPQALREVAAAAAHFAHSGSDYGIDGERLSLAGDSAGAALSLGAALLLRDEPDTAAALAGLPAPGRSAFDAVRSLLLFYGGYGLRDSTSRRLYGGWWDGMGEEDFADMLTAYCADADPAHPYADLLRADFTAGLPPAFIIGAELDPLADDSRALAHILRRCGRSCELHIEEGTLHSFLHFGRMMEAAGDALHWGAEFAAARFGS